MRVRAFRKTKPIGLLFLALVWAAPALAGSYVFSKPKVVAPCPGSCPKAGYSLMRANRFKSSYIKGKVYGGNVCAKCKSGYSFGHRRNYGTYCMKRSGRKYRFYRPSFLKPCPGGCPGGYNPMAANRFKGSLTSGKVQGGQVCAKCKSGYYFGNRRNYGTWCMKRR